eukprot:Gb_10357 [translate_table: standard]
MTTPINFKTNIWSLECLLLMLFLGESPVFLEMPSLFAYPPESLVIVEQGLEMIAFMLELRILLEFKQAHRRDDEIALLNAGMQVFLEEKDETWAVVEESLAEDTFSKPFRDSNKYVVDPYKRTTSYGAQYYEISQKGIAVDIPIVHLLAKLQVTGEAEYANDTPMPPNGQPMTLVLSKKPHSQIYFVDDSTTKDIPSFEEFVPCVGQVIVEGQLFDVKRTKAFNLVEVGQLLMDSE